MPYSDSNKIEKFKSTDSETKLYHFKPNYRNLIFEKETLEEAIEALKRDPKLIKRVGSTVTGARFKYIPDADYKAKMDYIANYIRENKLY